MTIVKYLPHVFYKMKNLPDTAMVKTLSDVPYRGFLA